jgi:hypothetical protein
MKTWKKIEETKKRTNDITGLKKRNEEKVQKVGGYLPINNLSFVNRKYSTSRWRTSKKGK